MLPNQGHELARAPLRGRPSGSRFGALLSLGVGLAGAHCTFPEYDRLAGGPNAGGGAAGAAGTPTGGGADTTFAGSGGTPAGAGSPEGGAGGLATDGGSPAASLCPELPGVVSYPDHCYDGEATGDETMADCGGGCQGCSAGHCLLAADCLSDDCAPQALDSVCRSPLTLQFVADDKNASVATLSWRMRVVNTDTTETFSLRDLKLRYYLDRNVTVEPMLVRSRQAIATIAGIDQSLDQAWWTIERVEPSKNTRFNAYVEVGFGTSGSLFPGDSIQLYQQLSTGDTSSRFDQRVNYSFSDQGQLLPWLNITIFHKDQLIWGNEPRSANPKACFFKGVNLNGQALTIAGQAWLGASEAAVTTNGDGASQGGTFTPAATGDLATALASFTTLDAGKTLEVPVPNETYLVFLYVVSPPDSIDTGTLLIQGLAPEQSGVFRAQLVDGGHAWGRLGPYRATVTNGELSVGVSQGTVHFAGLELFYPN